MVARLSLLQFGALDKVPSVGCTHSAKLTRQRVIQSSGRGSLDRSMVFA